MCLAMTLTNKVFPWKAARSAVQQAMRISCIRGGVSCFDKSTDMRLGVEMSTSLTLKLVGAARLVVDQPVHTLQQRTD